jgi:hypothetical protein
MTDEELDETDSELDEDLDGVELDEVELDEVLDGEDIVEDIVDDAVEDIDALELDDELVVPGGETDAAAVEIPVAEPRAEEEEDEDVLDLDEELHPDDVEAPLDTLLQERTASTPLEHEEEELEEEEAEADERGEVPTKIVPRRPGEFLCSSCFLVLPRNQLADEERMLCRDCA